MDAGSSPQRRKKSHVHHVHHTDARRTHVMSAQTVGAFGHAVTVTPSPTTPPASQPGAAHAHFHVQHHHHAPDIHAHTRRDSEKAPFSYLFCALKNLLVGPPDTPETPPPARLSRPIVVRVERPLNDPLIASASSSSTLSSASASSFSSTTSAAPPPTTVSPTTVTATAHTHVEASCMQPHALTAPSHHTSSDDDDEEDADAISTEDDVPDVDVHEPGLDSSASMAAAAVPTPCPDAVSVPVDTHRAPTCDAAHEPAPSTPNACAMPADSNPPHPVCTSPAAPDFSTRSVRRAGTTTVRALRAVSPKPHPHTTSLDEDLLCALLPPSATRLPMAAGSARRLVATAAVPVRVPARGRTQPLVRDPETSSFARRRRRKATPAFERATPSATLPKAANPTSAYVRPVPAPAHRPPTGVTRVRLASDPDSRAHAADKGVWWSASASVAPAPAETRVARRHVRFVTPAADESAQAHDARADGGNDDGDDDNEAADFRRQRRDTVRFRLKPEIIG